MARTSPATGTSISITAADAFGRIQICHSGKFATGNRHVPVIRPGSRRPRHHPDTFLPTWRISVAQNVPRFRQSVPRQKRPGTRRGEPKRSEAWHALYVPLPRGGHLSAAKVGRHTSAKQNARAGRASYDGPKRATLHLAASAGHSTWQGSEPGTISSPPAGEPMANHRSALGGRAANARPSVPQRSR